MNFLTFDLAGTVGWAARESDEFKSGTFTIPPMPPKWKKGLAPWELLQLNLKEDASRFKEFQRLIVELLDKFKPSFVAFETPNHRGGPSTRMCVGFATILQLECVKRGINITTLAPSSLKLYSAGSGRTDGKEPMKDTASQCFPHYNRNTDGKIGEGGDEADALCLLRWLINTVNDSANYNAGSVERAAKKLEALRKKRNKNGR